MSRTSAGPAGTTTTTSPTTSATTSRDEVHARLHQLYETLGEYLLMECKLQPCLRLPATLAPNVDEVTIEARDRAAYALRCVKACLDLPHAALVHAISLLDRFLTKMKVRMSLLSCISVSCMHIALQYHAHHVSQPTATTVTIDEIISVSQASCTSRDVERMSRVIQDKLALADDSTVTLLNWLRLYNDIVALLCPASEFIVPEEQLMNLLEILMCDYECVNVRVGELALVLLYNKINSQFLERVNRSEHVSDSAAEQYETFQIVMGQLQTYCQMSSQSIVETHELVAGVVSRYETRAALLPRPQRQRLQWRLSERTLKVLRPTARLTSLLPTIEEQHHISESSPVKRRARSGVRREKQRE